MNYENIKENFEFVKISDRENILEVSASSKIHQNSFKLIRFSTAVKYVKAIPIIFNWIIKNALFLHFLFREL
jgi:hypothetical protein